MDERTLVILGGYGNTGRQIAHLLLQETKVNLILGGRDPARAEALAGELRARFPGRCVDAAYVDAARPQTLREALRGAALLVVASGTSQYTENVARAALDAGVDLFDVIYSTEKLRRLGELAPEIEARQRLFITDGGFHPGLPAALVRAVAPSFDALHEARVGSVIKIDWSALQFSPATMEEFAAEFSDFQMLAFTGGRWQKSGWLSMVVPQKMAFSAPFGQQYVVPMHLQEMRALPDLYPELRETGFYVGGFNPITDFLISPLVMGGLKVAPRRGRAPLGRLFAWSLRAFSRPPYGTLLKLAARGLKEGQALAVDLVVAHEDAYYLTAVPAVACLLQYLDGAFAQSGLHFQAHIVHPARFLEDMARMGLTICREERLAAGEKIHEFV